MSEVHETVLELLNEGKISWPKNNKERNKFIIANFGDVWDALLNINIHANIEWLSDDANEDSVASAANTGNRAWHALASALMLVLVLEDSLGINITPSWKYDFQQEDFIYQKNKVRSRIKS